MSEANADCCPISPLLTLLGAKWTLEILRELTIQPTRTRSFLRHIPGLSMKCLQQRLKELDAQGMLKRIDYNERPLKVEYVITQRGKALVAVLEQLKSIADEMNGCSCSCPFEHDVSREASCCPKRRTRN